MIYIRLSPHVWVTAVAVLLLSQPVWRQVVFQRPGAMMISWWSGKLLIARWRETQTEIVWAFWILNFGIGRQCVYVRLLFNTILTWFTFGWAHMFEWLLLLCCCCLSLSGGRSCFKDPVRPGAVGSTCQLSKKTVSNVMGKFPMETHRHWNTRIRTSLIFAIDQHFRIELASLSYIVMEHHWASEFDSIWLDQDTPIPHQLLQLYQPRSHHETRWTCTRASHTRPSLFKQRPGAHQ